MKLNYLIVIAIFSFGLLNGQWNDKENFISQTTFFGTLVAGEQQLDVSYAEVESLVEEVKLFPNPTPKNVTISFGEEQKLVMVKVLDITGKTIQERVYKDSKACNFNLNHPNGIYLVQVKTPEGTSASFKVVKYER